MDEGIATVQRRLRRRGVRRRAAVAMWWMLGLGAGAVGGASIATLGGAGRPAKPPAAAVSRATSSAPRATASHATPPWDPTGDPDVQIELAGGPHALRILLGPGPVEGEWRQDGHRFTLVQATLDLVQADRAGGVRRGRTTVAATAWASYRLRFSIDRCEGLSPAPSLWHPCAKFPGTLESGHWFERRELLVHRVSTRWATGESHTVHAACVPTTGDGPTCALEGTRTDWLDHTPTP